MITVINADTAHTAYSPYTKLGGAMSFFSKPRRKSPFVQDKLFEMPTDKQKEKSK